MVRGKEDEQSKHESANNGHRGGFSRLLAMTNAIANTHLPLVIDLLGMANIALLMSVKNTLLYMTTISDST